MFSSLASFQARRITAMDTPRLGHDQLVFVFMVHLGALAEAWLPTAFGAFGPFHGRTAELGLAAQAGVFVSTDQNDRPGLRFAATGARNSAILRDVPKNQTAVVAQDVHGRNRWNVC